MLSKSADSHQTVTISRGNILRYHTKKDFVELSWARFSKKLRNFAIIYSRFFQILRRLRVNCHEIGVKWQYITIYMDKNN